MEENEEEATYKNQRFSKLKTNYFRKKNFKIIESISPSNINLTSFTTKKKVQCGGIII